MKNLSTFKPFCCLLLTAYCLLLIGCKKKSSYDPLRSVSLSLKSSSYTLSADDSSTATITATVEYEDNNTPASGLPVGFSATLGTITDSAITNSNGIATATLISDTISGNSTVGAYCENKYKTLTVEFLSVGEGEEIKISSLTADPQSIPANGVSQSLITLVLKYLDESPAPDKLINFSTNLGIITQCDTTDATGTATATLTSADITGIATVIAAYDETVKDSVDVTFTVVRDTVPASIILYSIDHTSIYVKGVGYNETSTLIFQIRDASGNPVAGTHQVDFTIQGGPGGGEYLYPDSAMTDTLSLVTTHLNSGTKSGPVTILATVNGTSISSHPIPVAIVSGPPVQEHFTMSTEKLNLYALGITGVEDLITAFVGDTYGNPVPDSTIVWFSTDCGIIRPGSEITSGGTATNTLISCAPWPDSGLFYVYGETKDGIGNTIRDSIRVLWSGRTILTLTPTLFTINDCGWEDFTFTLHDINGNPLVGGTSITVSADVGQLRGDINIEIPDIQSGYTLFNFSLHDEELGDILAPENCKVSVDVTSQNGNASAAAYGTID